MANVKDTIQRVGEKVRPGRDFGERRAVVERGRSATWQITIALIAATIGAAALGYLAVQLYFLPQTLREAQLNRVPDLTGMEVDDAVDKAEASGYVVAVVGRDYSDEVDRDEVIYQSPPPDMYLPRGDTLRILASLGSAEERIPDVSGLDLDHARRTLAQIGIRIAGASREASDIHPQGTVIRTEPAAGTPIAETGSGVDPVLAVTVVLSRGGSRLTMPDVRELTLAEARDTLEVYSLTIGEVTGLEETTGLSESERARENARVVVTQQDPSPGRLVPAGSAVNLTLGPREARRAAAAEVTPPTEREGPDELPEETLEEEFPEEVPAELPDEELPGTRALPPDTTPR
ncbi:MAG: PASTA domain-containing protein [Gemmatimonadota bacterium]